MISVIIPCYNTEDYLETCLNSVLNQSYDNFEIICIDDNSTDSTVDIIKKIQKETNRIKLIQNTNNMGSGFSRNIGIIKSQGDYIFFLDSDDWISQDAFEKIHKQFMYNNVDIVLFKNLVYYEDKREIGHENYYEMKFMDSCKNKVFNPLSIKEEYLFRIPCPCWNKCYSKKFLTSNNIKFPNENLIQQDNPFYFEVMTKSKNVYYMNDYLYFRRRHENSVMTLTNERLFDNFEISELILKVFIDNEELYSKYKHELLNLIFKIYYNKYYIINKELKTQYFNECIKTIETLCEKYDISNDILREVDDFLLDIFNIKKFN